VDGSGYRRGRTRPQMDSGTPGDRPHTGRTVTSSTHVADTLVRPVHGLVGCRAPSP